MKNLSIIFIILFFMCRTLAAEKPEDTDLHKKNRKKMVESQIEYRGVRDRTVLDAMNKTPRHYFVPKSLKKSAYKDRPLPIGEGQTISQPYIVALMTAELDLPTGAKVLEIGTGSGYQAAVLSEIAEKVYTIEIKKKLYQETHERLNRLGYTNIETRHGDGYFGWNDVGLFDGIMITAAVNHIPPPLLRQLKDGGKLILPLGNPLLTQQLVLVTRNGEDFTVRQIIGVLFVPMTGHAMDEKPGG